MFNIMLNVRSQPPHHFIEEEKIFSFPISRFFCRLLSVSVCGNREADGSKSEVNNPKLFISTSWVGDVSQ